MKSHSRLNRGFTLRYVSLFPIVSLCELNAEYTHGSSFHPSLWNVAVVINLISRQKFNAQQRDQAEIVNEERVSKRLPLSVLEKLTNGERLE
jgi:hypothetical protein